MKKIIGIIGIIGILAMFSFTPVPSTVSSEKKVQVEAVSLDCYGLAQGYYLHLVDEGMSNRRAGRKARDLRDACEEIQ